MLHNVRHCINDSPVCAHTVGGMLAKGKQCLPTAPHLRLQIFLLKQRWQLLGSSRARTGATDQGDPLEHCFTCLTNMDISLETNLGFSRLALSSALCHDQYSHTVYLHCPPFENSTKHYTQTRHCNQTCKVHANHFAALVERPVKTAAASPLIPIQHIPD